MFWNSPINSESSSRSKIIIIIKTQLFLNWFHGFQRQLPAVRRLNFTQRFPILNTITLNPHHNAILNTITLEDHNVICQRWIATYLPHQTVINIGVEFFNFNNATRVWSHLCALFDPASTKHTKLNTRNWRRRNSYLLRKRNKCHEERVIL